MNRKEIKQLSIELNIPVDEYFRLRGYEIGHLSHKKVHDHILTLLKNGAMRVHDFLGKAVGYAPRGWPTTDQFYFRIIGRLFDEGTLIMTEMHRSVYDSVIKLAQD